MKFPGHCAHSGTQRRPAVAHFGGPGYSLHCPGMLYESCTSITILSTLPSAGVGALLAIILTGNDLNVIAMIGILLLIGMSRRMLF